MEEQHPLQIKAAAVVALALGTVETAQSGMFYVGLMTLVVSWAVLDSGKGSWWCSYALLAVLAVWQVRHYILNSGGNEFALIILLTVACMYFLGRDESKRYHGVEIRGGADAEH